MDSTFDHGRVTPADWHVAIAEGGNCESIYSGPFTIYPPEGNDVLYVSAYGAKLIAEYGAACRQLVVQPVPYFANKSEQIISDGLYDLLYEKRRVLGEAILAKMEEAAIAQPWESYDAPACDIEDSGLDAGIPNDDLDCVACDNDGPPRKGHSSPIPPSPPCAVDYGRSPRGFWPAGIGTRRFWRGRGFSMRDMD